MGLGRCLGRDGTGAVGTENLFTPSPNLLDQTASILEGADLQLTTERSLELLELAERFGASSGIGQQLDQRVLCLIVEGIALDPGVRHGQRSLEIPPP